MREVKPRNRHARPQKLFQHLYRSRFGAQRTYYLCNIVILFDLCIHDANAGPIDIRLSAGHKLWSTDRKGTFVFDTAAGVPDKTVSSPS